MSEFTQAKAKIIKDAMSQVELPPKNFSSDYNVTQGLVGAATLGGLGAYFGSSIGVAALGGAISGAWILAPLFALGGLMAGRK